MRKKAAPLEIIPYKPQVKHTLGVEVLTLSDIRARAQKLKEPNHMIKPQRLEMVMFLLYTAGRGVHTIDFEPYEVRVGSLLFIPRQSTHQFPDTKNMKANILVVSPQFILPERLMYLKPLLSDRAWLRHTQLSKPLQQDFMAACASIQSDQNRYGANESLHPWLSALLHQRVYTWLLQLRLFWEAQGLLSEQAQTRDDVVFEFKQLIEKCLLERWTVQDYAKKLGYAERTLSRACLAIEGKTAKTILDERMVLEAQRLLAHSTDTVEAIALRLGFASTSNFVQFFKRLTDNTPLAFRQRY